MNEQTGQALISFRPPPFKSRCEFFLPNPVYVHHEHVKTERCHAVNFQTAGKSLPRSENYGSQTPMKSHPEFNIPQTAAACCRHGSKWHEKIEIKNTRLLRTI
jgi:hypothetical protein